MHKILIVDDDKTMCDLLRACLSEGYEVIDTVRPEGAQRNRGTQTLRRVVRGNSASFGPVFYQWAAQKD